MTCNGLTPEEIKIIEVEFYRNENEVNGVVKTESENLKEDFGSK